MNSDEICHQKPFEQIEMQDVWEFDFKFKRPTGHRMIVEFVEFADHFLIALN